MKSENASCKDDFSLDALDFAGIVELLGGFLSGAIAKPWLDAAERTPPVPASRE